MSQGRAVEEAARSFTDQLSRYRVLFLEGGIFSSICVETFYSYGGDNEDKRAEVGKSFERAIVEEIASRVPAIKLIDDDELIINAYTRLLCVRPLSEYNRSGVNGLRDNEILLAAHSALLLNIAELEKRSIFDVLFDMTVEGPADIAEKADDLSRLTNDPDLRDAFVNVSDRFISLAARMRHRNEIEADGLPSPVIPESLAKPCQIFHAICTKLKLPPDTAEELAADLFGFDSWIDLEAASEDRNLEKGPFDEDIDATELKTRRELQVDILSTLDISRSRAEAIWRHLRPTSRVVAPSLGGLEPDGEG
jgi:hypothetical protein